MDRVSRSANSLEARVEQFKGHRGSGSEGQKASSSAADPRPARRRPILPERVAPRQSLVPAPSHIRSAARPGLTARVPATESCSFCDGRSTTARPPWRSGRNPGRHRPRQGTWPGEAASSPAQGDADARPGAAGAEDPGGGSSAGSRSPKGAFRTPPLKHSHLETLKKPAQREIGPKIQPCSRLRCSRGAVPRRPQDRCGRDPWPWRASSQEREGCTDGAPWGR
jgi:hypothetical protein